MTATIDVTLNELNIVLSLSGTRNATSTRHVRQALFTDQISRSWKESTNKTTLQFPVSSGHTCCHLTKSQPKQKNACVCTTNEVLVTSFVNTTANLFSFGDGQVLGLHSASPFLRPKKLPISRSECLINPKQAR